MSTINSSVVEVEMYEDATKYLGVAQVTLPSVQFPTQDISGAGIMGQISAVMFPEVNPMQIQIQMLTMSKEAFSIAEPRMHTWTFREIQSSVNPANSAHGYASVKHVIHGVPTSMEGGTLRKLSTSDASITATVYYWKQFHNGNPVLEIDPLNYICNINGTDYAAALRAALEND